MTARRRILAYLPAAMWAAYLLYLGSRPFDGTLPDLPLPADKIAHLVLYGGLGFLAAWGWRRAGRWPFLAVPMIAALMVGAVDEWNQRGVPTRSADVGDWLVDAAAILIAFALLGWRALPRKNG